MSEKIPYWVVAFAFGYREEEGRHTPGSSNQDLARVLYANYKHAPKVL